MEFDAARVGVGLLFLLVAGAMDWRDRRVRDPLWIGLGAVALVLVEIELLRGGAPWHLHLVSAATAVLYFGVFFGEEMWTEEGFRFRPLRLLLFLATPFALLVSWRLSTDEATLGAFYRLLTMPALIIVAHGLYEFGLLRGGADAKAFMTLGLLFPGVYPHVASFPILAPPDVAEPLLAVLFPFAFVVLVDTALLFLVVPLWFLARNAATGNSRFPLALVGYRVGIDEMPKHAWLLDRIEGDRHIVTSLPLRKEDREEQLQRLRERGFEKVWVTPQLPLVSAMFVGFLLAVFAGNLLLAPFGLATP